MTGPDRKPEDENDPVLKALDKMEEQFESKIEPKLEAFHNYMMTPSREPKRFFSTNKRIVLAVLGAFIAGLYFLSPHESAEEKHFLVFLILGGILPIVLIGSFLLWLFSKILDKPLPRKYLKETLAELDVKSDEDKARDNARNNGPIDPDAK